MLNFDILTYEWQTNSAKVITITVEIGESQLLDRKLCSEDDPSQHFISILKSDYYSTRQVYHNCLLYSLITRLKTGKFD